ncbi:MAG: FG-GAP repeat protein [Candidatus Cloacimonetes bacterium]|nr:FG-GAP repeat protein [Candidatus Cloacimonadota bacterium]
MSGDYAVIGAFCDEDNGNNSGSAYIFQRNGTNWIEQAKSASSMLLKINR